LRPSRCKIFFTSRSVCLTHCRASFYDGCRGVRHARHAPTRKNRSARKPLYYRCFLKVEKICVERRAFSRCNASHASHALVKTQDVVATRARVRSIKRKCWCFCSAVVIRRQCSRSPRALYDIATHSWLGGQHGEEAKESCEGSEKGREKDEAPEEEVTTRCFQSSTSNEVDDCVKRAGASRRAVSASRSHFGTAGPGRRQRASARHGFELYRSAWTVKKRDGRSPHLAVAEASAPGLEA